MPTTLKSVSFQYYDANTSNNWKRIDNGKPTQKQNTTRTTTQIVCTCDMKKSENEKKVFHRITRLQFPL